MKISEALFATVDTESTGLPDKPDEHGVHALVQVAGHLWKLEAPLQRGREISLLVDPLRPIPPDAMGVHHIRESDVAGEAPPERAVELLARFVPTDAVVVAHNLQHDLAFLPPLRDRKTLCSERLAHHVMPDVKNFKNQTLRYSIERETGEIYDLPDGLNPHDALADVLVTTYNAAELIRRYLVAGGADDIAALLVYARQPYEYKAIPFGQHRDKLFSDPTVDLGWLRWAWRSDRGKNDPDFRYTVEREAARRQGKPTQQSLLGNEAA